MRYFAQIRYVGTDFCGFQVQKKGRTVQGVLQDALSMLFGCPCPVTGCSRTDSGVHAEGFCLTFEPQSPDAPYIPPEAIPRAILQFLPHDLSLIEARPAPEGFHPRYDAKGKEYRYRMRYGAVPDPFLFGRVWQIPYRLHEDGFANMQAAAQLYIGEHDFTAFMCTDSDMENCVRTVHDAYVTRVGDEVVFSVSANGFLYNMVRIMVGTLFEIGAGRRDAESIRFALSGRDRLLAGMTAPPDGLYLHRVFYPEHLQKQLFD